MTGNPNLVADSGIDTPPNNPLELLRTWFDTALQLKVCEPYGITLATVDLSGQPSTRVVLLKGFDLKTSISSSIDYHDKCFNVIYNHQLNFKSTKIYLTT